MLYWFVVLESDLAEKIEAEKSEYHNPYSEIYLSVENTPMVGLVSDAEELESERDLDESEHDLHRVEPSAAALLELLEKRRGECKYGERKGKCDRECKHGHHRLPELALG